jgi:hypothetical protein
MTKRSWAVAAAAVLTLLLYYCAYAVTGHINLSRKHENYGSERAARPDR